LSALSTLPAFPRARHPPPLAPHPAPLDRGLPVRPPRPARPPLISYLSLLTSPYLLITRKVIILSALSTLPAFPRARRPSPLAPHPAPLDRGLPVRPPRPARPPLISYLSLLTSPYPLITRKVIILSALSILPALRAHTFPRAGRPRPFGAAPANRLS
jgi:hypothetical protein